MRLTPDEVMAIKDCARRHFGEQAVVRLFGSRVRDDLRGGDIDLHVSTETQDQAEGNAEIQFKRDLECRIGERRVDVLVNGPGGPRQPIEHIAILTGVIL